MEQKIPSATLRLRGGIVKISSFINGSGLGVRAGKSAETFTLERQPHYAKPLLAAVFLSEFNCPFNVYLFQKCFIVRNNNQRFLIFIYCCR